MSQNPQRRCDCDSGKAVRLFDARDYISGDQFEIIQCSKCGLAFTHPAPEDLEWRRYYPDAYYGDQSTSRFPKAIELLQTKLYGSRAREVERFASGKRGRVLDIGCGRGFLLRAFQARGWEVAGTEVSEAAAAHAQRKLNLPVLVGTLDELPLAESSFDAAVMWHVLEHVERPNDALRTVNRLLRPSGVFLVAVPNLGSCEARMTRDKWFHLDVPRHLTHFSRRALKQCLEATGFRIEKISKRALEYDFFSAMQSVLNRVGLPHNWLYNYLRQPGARTRTTASLAQLGLHTLCLPLGELAGCATLIAGGSTLVVHARKV